MEVRSRCPSLKKCSLLCAVHMTVNAMMNILLQERKEKGKDSCIKRKRSLSCSTYTECDGTHRRQIVTMYGKGSQHEHKANSDIDREQSELHGKRKRSECDGDSITYHVHKRLKTDGKGSQFKVNQMLRKDKPRSQDDISVIYEQSNFMLSDLESYMQSLPATLRSDFLNCLLKETVKRMNMDGVDIGLLKRTIIYIFCKKLLNFSTTEIQEFPFYIEEIVYSKLRYCRKLVSLNLTLVPRNEHDVMNATIALQRLGHLQSLCLVPQGVYSYHWAIKLVAQNCHKIKEFKIMYNGDECSDVQDGIASLSVCQTLRSLWLFHFGHKSEGRFLTHLLRTLTKLQAVFHKELLTAILDMNYSKESNEYYTVDKLSLERIDFCWYHHALGYQLIYLPDSYLVQIAQTCPNVALLNLVGPPPLDGALARLTNLHTLILKQVSLIICLEDAFQQVNLQKITSLNFSDVWNLNYDIVSSLARYCPQLQSLIITCSSLDAKGNLQPAPSFPNFPCLREVVLVPSMLDGRPSLTTPTAWQLGASLTHYILEGSSCLNSMHLQYSKDDIHSGDIPTAYDLQSLLCKSKPALQMVILEYPPEVSEDLVMTLIEESPALTTLGSITTWPLSLVLQTRILSRYHKVINIY